MRREVNMKDFFEAPAELRKGQGWNLFVELLVFVLVFVVVTFGEMAVLLPGQMLMLYGNDAYNEAAAAMDLTKAVEIMTEVMNSNGYLLLMLFANIMMIVIVLLFCGFLQKRSMESVGFVREHAQKEYLLGAGVGFLMFSAAVLICVITGTLRFEGISASADIGLLLLFLAGYLVQGMAEEVLCRGYLLGSVARRYSLPVAIVTNSVVFALLHSFNSGLSVLALLNLTLFGIFASVCYVRRGNLWFVGALHSVWNFVQGNVYGVQVSGMNKTVSVFDSVSTAEGSLINGGAFGLEGGLAVTFVYGTGIAVLLFLQVRENKSRAVQPQ